MEIRVATSVDVVDIEQLVCAAYSPYITRIGRAPAPMGADYHELVANGTTHVLVIDGEVAGVLVTIPGPDHLLVENVALAPRAQGRGHGRALLVHAEQQAARLRLPQVRLYTNAAMTENIQMYPRLGYTEVDRRTENGFERVYFVKDVR
jgi:ribosomal protein S18 acetylase RimI-like enzyme